MPGMPNAFTAKELLQHFRDYKWERERIASLKKSISEQEEQIKLHQEQLRRSMENIQKKMQEMDVYAVGNAGYEGRRFELLLILSQL